MVFLLWSERRQYHFSIFEECSGLNMVWIVNNDTFLGLSTQIGTSMVMVIMSLLNPSIKYSFASMSTASASACTSGSFPGWYSSSWSRCLWGGWSSAASHDLSPRRSFPRLVAASLNVMYSYDAIVVLKSSRRHSRASWSTMAMHVDAICAFVWVRQYEVSIYVSPTRMRFDGRFNAHG